jgi:NIPSNAP
MQLPRRQFMKAALAATAASAVDLRAAPAATGESAREIYELRAYRLKPGAPPDLLDAYLEKAFLPALDRRGVKNVGAFSEVDVDKKAATMKPKENAPVWVLIAHPTFDSFVSGSSDLNADPSVQAAGAAYLDVPKASPVFDRIDVWLYRAFKGMPQMELPEFSKARTPSRFFEMRDYQSHGEKAALNKMAMFDNGEIPLMKDLGMSPVFFGQGIAGPDLPHLRYITSGADIGAHFAAWAKFGPAPVWKAMSADPQYKDNTSKNTSRFLIPRPYSAI